MEDGNVPSRHSDFCKLRLISPAMDEPTRDKFYGPGGDEWGDDDAEYELEPPDADVIALQKQRAQEEIELSTLSIDVDEIYRDLDGRSDLELVEQGRNARFQFQIKHLLVLTAVVAVGMTLSQMKMIGAVLTLGALIAAGGTLAYMDLKQQRRWADAQRRFQAKYERRRQFFERRERASAGSAQSPATIYDDLKFGKSPGYPEWASDAERPRAPFRFQFSMWQLMVVMTVAAIVFSLIHLMGGPQNAASLLGFIALVGLFVHAFGLDPPEVVVLGWWLILLLYIVLSVGAAISSAF